MPSLPGPGLSSSDGRRRASSEVHDAPACGDLAVKQDERAPFARALWRARVAAYPPGEYVDQEGFMRAGEILALARQAGVAPGISVLDLCCGVAGPGRFITQELGCAYLGVDLSASAIEIARERSGDLHCQFEVARIPPIPAGPFDVVLLFETLLAFPEKETLLRQISTGLTAGGRFAFTMEEGLPLVEAERAKMPDADTVWPTPLSVVIACLERVGLIVSWQDDCSQSHRAQANSLIDAFTADAANIAAQIGRRALEELLAAHQLWSDWLREGRLPQVRLRCREDGGAAHPARGRRSVSPEQTGGSVALLGRQARRMCHPARPRRQRQRRLDQGLNRRQRVPPLVCDGVRYIDGHDGRPCAARAARAAKPRHRV